MGQEIESSHFSNHDFNLFNSYLKDETALLSELLNKHHFSNIGSIAGFEIEALLISLSGAPAPVNKTFLNKLDNPLVVHELAAFNVELNSNPIKLQSNALSIMEAELQNTWRNCCNVANELSIEMMMIGILPSLQEHQLTLENMSKLNRYKALNDQVLNLRKGKPLKLDIHGTDSLQTTHQSVMLESACTSLQLHLQVPYDVAAQFYNASIMLSAPIIAATANSPFLFGCDLWDETRIPLFEQAVELGSEDYRRVTFGSSYIKHTMFECYEENLKHYPVLVPFKEEGDINQLNHLRFHNGTIWRWNRPLIGFDQNGTPHIRIEHRVIPSGPTIIDSIANAAFYYGLVHDLAENIDTLIEQLSFQKTKDNFYKCAKHGLSAMIDWPDQGNIITSELLLHTLIPAARRGLKKLEILDDDINKYIAIIEQRIETQQNGANWQRLWIDKYGKDFHRLTRAYLDRQDSGLPVHQWTI
ncbi:MAG: hypothetical protein DHS20C09_05970 [marine bacterium B5-7]|nr:MAG: hypothetical protein DHS20C09_05970 [marine bacterium B5-7]